MRDKNKLWLPIVLTGIALLVCYVGFRQAETSSQLAAIEQPDASRACEASEQIVQLPEDGNTYHTILLLHSDWTARPNERELVAWFKTEPSLVSVTAQTKFWQLTADDPVYQANYAPTTPSLPAVLVMTETGQTVYKASGANMPAPQQVAAELCTVFDKRPWLRIRPWLRPRPSPQPSPDGCPDGNCPDQKKPPLNVDVRVHPIEDIRPQPEPQPEGSAVWVVAAIAAALGGLASLVYHIRKDNG